MKISRGQIRAQKQIDDATTPIARARWEAQLHEYQLEVACGQADGACQDVSDEIAALVATEDQTRIDQEWPVLKSKLTAARNAKSGPYDAWEAAQQVTMLAKQALRAENENLA